jgi:hypothetical protein
VGQRIRGVRSRWVDRGLQAARFENLLTLRDVTVRGSKHIAHVEKMLLVFGKENVSHLHTLPTRVDPVAADGKP